MADEPVAQFNPVMILRLIQQKKTRPDWAAPFMKFGFAGSTVFIDRRLLRLYPTELAECVAAVKRTTVEVFGNLRDVRQFEDQA